MRFFWENEPVGSPSAYLLGNSRVHALRDKYACNKEFAMSAQPPAPKPREKGGIGLFQMLGIGLLLLFVVFLLIVVVRSLFASA